MKTQRAIEHFEGVAKLAEALGISRAAVYQWGVDVPEGRAFQLEVLTDGALKAHCENDEDQSSGTNQNPPLKAAAF